MKYHLYGAQHVFKGAPPVAPAGAQHRRSSQSVGKVALCAHDDARQQTHCQPSASVSLAEQLLVSSTPGGGGGGGGRTVKPVGPMAVPALLDPTQLDGFPWMAARSSSAVPRVGPA